MDGIRQSAVRGLKGGDEFLVSPHPGDVKICIAGPNNLVPRTDLMPVNMQYMY